MKINIKSVDRGFAEPATKGGKDRSINIPALTLFLALALGVLGVPPALAGLSYNACVDAATGGSNNCTANDVTVSQLVLIAGPTSCIVGEQINVTLQATAIAGSNERYDIGFFINQLGGSAKTGGATACYRDILNPISTTNTDLNLTGGAGPFYNADLGSANICGDLQQNVNNKYNFTAQITCADNFGNDGIADVDTCVSWDNQDEQTCASISDAEPSNPAKCRCEPVNVTGLTALESGTITVSKVLSPTGDPGLFNLQIDGSTAAANVGNGGTTGAVVVSAGSTPPGTGAIHSVGETAGTATDLANYATTILCTSDLSNIASASNAGPLSFTVLPDEDWTCSITNTLKTPLLTLVKSITGGNPYAAVGGTINYSYLVTNSGNVSLTGPVTVADNKATVTCPAVNTVGNLDGELDPGEAVTCTASYSVTQADLNAGSVTNTATASADGTSSGPDSETATATQSPALNVTKTVTSSGPYDSVGDTITYNITVQNTGNTTLTGVTVTDPGAVLGTCSPVIPATLAPGASVVCPASHAVTQADLDAGSYTNTAVGDSDQTGPDSDDETVTITRNPALTLVKSITSGSPFDRVGDVIKYSYLVTNSGNVSLSGPVTVADDKAPVTCPAVSTVGNGDGKLDPGETITCTASYTVTQADLRAGSVTNIAKASAGGTDSNPDQETAKAPVPIPTISAFGLGLLTLLLAVLPLYRRRFR